MNLQAYSKAIAGGIVAAVVAELARYGWHPDGQTVTALGVVVTAIVGYASGHVVTYFAPPNNRVNKIDPGV